MRGIPSGFRDFTLSNTGENAYAHPLSEAVEAFLLSKRVAGYLAGLAHLMQFYRRHRVHDRGLACGERILQLDPLREEIHREMMQLYLENGQRALAIKQYQACREIMAAELNIAPMEETQALYTQITGQTPFEMPPSDLVGERVRLRQLRLAREGFERG